MGMQLHEETSSEEMDHIHNMVSFIDPSSLSPENVGL